MKKATLLTSLIILTFSFLKPLYAQTPIKPCGSTEGRSEWLKEYQRNPDKFKNSLEKSMATIYLPVTIHIVGSDDTLGMAPLEAVLSSFCQLNEDFLASDIQFFIEGPIRYIYETAFFDHDSVKAGGIRMLQYNIPNTINVYFVGSPAGNCGYNLPYAGIAMSNSCMNGHTFAHEMGHCLKLPHTFLGWEGGIGWNGSPVQVFNGPAPERVTINYTDFKDTIFLNDTLIIDTVYVEKVARSGASANCDYAADGFCDTPADYLAYRWVCSSTNRFSSVVQRDPDTVAFNSDGWYIMSYAYDECQVGFSLEQTDAMRTFVQTQRPNWLYNQNPFNDPVSAAVLLSPSPGAIIPTTFSPRFEWAASQGATHYLLEIYKEPYSTNQVVERVVVTDTFYQTSKLFTPRPNSFPYAWRVLPYNNGYTCTGFSQPRFFNSAISSDVSNVPLIEINWTLNPNIISAGSALKMQISDVDPQDIQMNIYSAAGIMLWNSSFEITQSQDLEIRIPSEWTSGLYFIELKTKSGYKKVKKFVIR